MTFIPKPHEIYKHFKGGLYQILAVAEHTETGEMLAVYQAMYGEFKIYARPLSMFISKVDRQKYPRAQQEYRFELYRGGDDTIVQAEADVPDESGQAVPDSLPQEEDLELNIDPLVLQFLDAGTYVDRLNILAGLHHRITNDMITTMAIACDVEVPEGDLEERYDGLRSCLLMLDKYECSRLR